MTYLLQPDGRVFDAATALEVGAPALIYHEMVDVPQPLAESRGHEGP